MHACDDRDSRKESGEEKGASELDTSPLVSQAPPQLFAAIYDGAPSAIILARAVSGGPLRGPQPCSSPLGSHGVSQLGIYTCMPLVVKMSPCSFALAIAGTFMILYSDIWIDSWRWSSFLAMMIARRYMPSGRRCAIYKSMALLSPRSFMSRSRAEQSSVSFYKYRVEFTGRLS